MAKTQTKEREQVRDERPAPAPAVVICEGCSRPVNPVTMTCGCFRG